MIERAAAVGVNLLWQTVVTGLHPDGVWLGNNLVRSRWIVGADGAHSRVRRWAGLDETPATSSVSLSAATIVFLRGPAAWNFTGATTASSMSLRLRTMKSVSPPSPGDPHLRLDAVLAKLPAVGGRLEGLEQTSVERGAVSATRRLRHVYRGRTALIGDASGSVDAITGEGLCLAFRQAILLSQCFAVGNLQPYQARHRNLARRPALMSWLNGPLRPYRHPGPQCGQRAPRIAPKLCPTTISRPCWMSICVAPFTLYGRHFR